MLYNQRCLLLILSVTAVFTSVSSGRRTSECNNVKASFSDLSAVASTIPRTPVYEDSLELCRFTNHSESQRPSCCSHATERELLIAAHTEYSAILRRETDTVRRQLGPESRFSHHYQRMLSISKRMSEYEVGAALNLHHSAGREIFTKFYQTLENILLRFERSNTVFNAGDDLMNELFVYVVREAKHPGSRAEPDPVYHECLKTHRRALDPAPFPVKLENQVISLHYSAVAASYLSEAMTVVYQALNVTRDYNVSSHCLRDMTKLNHCQKCYGYTEMRPCREFCEDVYLVCLTDIVRLDQNWEYHRKIIKILSEYILKRVDLQELLNGFHTELKANIDLAVLSYSTYKKQLDGFCGPPKFLDTMPRLKVWDRPAVTSYDGDFSGDLRKLVVNLELRISGFFSTLYSSICADEPTSSSGCWDGLTERVNKQKFILEFSDLFAPYPEKSTLVDNIISSIKRIRGEVLRIFLKGGPKKQDGDEDEDELEGSGSGDGPDDMTDDNEPGNVVEIIPGVNHNIPKGGGVDDPAAIDGVTETVTRSTYDVKDPDDPIEIDNSDINSNTIKPISKNYIKTTPLPKAEKKPLIGSPSSAGSKLRLSNNLFLCILVILNIYILYH